MKRTLVLLAATVFVASVALAAQNSNASQSAPAEPQTIQSAGQTANSSAGDQSSNAALQGRIQNALRNEPTLGSSKVSVNVTDGSIDLSGTVGSSKDKQTAERIAASFDGNRQLNDKLVVTGHGHSDMAPEHPAMNNGGTGNAPNPAVNPNPGR